MNTVLRKVARQLRYRPIRGLVNPDVVITGVGVASTEVHNQLRDVLPTGVEFTDFDRGVNIRGAIAKYGILDLTYAAKGNTWDANDRGGLALLKELGFVLADRKEREEALIQVLRDEAQWFLQGLLDDIDKGHTLLKVFLAEEPAPDYSHRPVQLTLPQNYFPKKFKVYDACMTNAAGVWSQKHFYL